MPPMPPMDGGQDPMRGQMPPMPPQGGADPMMGGNEQMPPQDDMGNQFGGNFDAGVEADEEEDPKRFIQQLTGKLSQSLNKYNNENGDDEELSKYVGKMIIKAAAKGLDGKGRKDLIKSINTTDSNDDEEGDMGTDEGMGGEEPQMPMNEKSITKGELKTLAECFGEVCMEQQPKDAPKRKDKISKKTPFTPKKFN